MASLRHSFASALLLLLPAAAAADWLVMRDGSRTETKGPWEVRGKLLVFTLPNGTLGSVRADAADLEASRLATEEAAKPPQPPAPTPPKKEAVLKLTDKDVAHVDASGAAPVTIAGTTGSSDAASASGAATGTTQPAGEKTQPAEAPQTRLKVSNWQADPAGSADGVSLVGQITNASADYVQDVRMTAALLDEQGEVLATGDALLGAKALMPGQGTSFRVTFPGVINFVSVRFELKGFPFKTQNPAPTGG